MRQSYHYAITSTYPVCYNITKGKMSKITSQDKQTGGQKEGQLWKKLLPLLILLIVIAVSVGIFYFYQRYPDRVEELEAYGYLGAFIITLVGNAAVILAAPVLPLLSAIGAIMYPTTGLSGPITVGLVGGVAAGIGERVCYMVGYRGRGVVERVKLYKRLVEWLGRWGAIAIFILSIVPFCVDLVGIAAGVLHFPLWKFVLACWLGRTILYIVVALAGAWGWEAILRYLG